MRSLGIRPDHFVRGTTLYGIKFLWDGCKWIPNIYGPFKKAILTVNNTQPGIERLQYDKTHIYVLFTWKKSVGLMVCMNWYENWIGSPIKCSMWPDWLLRDGTLSSIMREGNLKVADKKNRYEQKIIQLTSSNSKWSCKTKLISVWVFWQVGTNNTSQSWEPSCRRD